MLMDSSGRSVGPEEQALALNAVSVALTVVEHEPSGSRAYRLAILTLRVFVTAYTTTDELLELIQLRAPSVMQKDGPPTTGEAGRCQNIMPCAEHPIRN